MPTQCHQRNKKYRVKTPSKFIPRGFPLLKDSRSNYLSRMISVKVRTRI